jgi:outer membrane protein assembly factor BamB
MSGTDLIFLGVKGSVVALDRATGTEVWRTKLKGDDFVNVVLLDAELYATARGEIFSIDQSTGQIRWSNPLKGLGWGMVTVAVPGNTAGQAPSIAAKRRREQAAAAAAAAAS